MRHRCSSVLLLAVSGLLLSCSSNFTSATDAAVNDSDGVTTYPEMQTGQCLPGHDEDQDKIPDDVEGCKVDTDGDKIPDYADSDSDNDKIPDALEVGSDPKNPVDSDKDGKPDTKDTDSDNDAVDDGNEDLNGDGKLGCCMDTCGEKRKGCAELKADECGKGQKCVNGACQPLVDFLCAAGETDPRKAVTFPGGKPDKDLPSFVCHKPDETGTKGLKQMLFKKNTTGDWNVALEKDAFYGETKISSPKALEAAATFDLSGPDQAEAGFVVSLPTSAGADVGQLAAQLVTKISQQLPGKSTVLQLVSGSAKTSHDKFPTVVNTLLEITLTAGKNPPTVRNDLLPVILSRGASELTLPAANFGPTSTSLVLAFQTLVRPADNRLLVMGAVADKAMWQDNTKKTGFHLDDMSNGTGLATSTDSDTVACDDFLLENKPIADIIWVVDESGSMEDNQTDIVNNAGDFFARAVKAGLDFRMGVTGVKAPESGVLLGKFCSKSSTNVSDDGGTDRFLLPTEQQLFKDCVKNPPYYEGGWEYGLANSYETVTRHLPRKAGDPAKIRPEATLVIVIATDEAPQEFKLGSTYNGKQGWIDELWGAGEIDINNCTSSKMSQINSYIADWITLFQGKHATYGAEAKAIVHLIGGVCKSNCDQNGNPTQYPWGYEQISKATGGQIGDVCQKNLGTTLQLIIDSITGAASPAVLSLVPISASLAVAVNQTQLQRSRVQGFDYVSSSNSLLFVGVPFNKGDQAVASYRRWVKQQPIE